MWTAHCIWPQPVASTTTLLSAAKLTTLLLLSATVGVWVSSRNVVCIVRITDIVVVIVDDDNDNDGYNKFREWLFTKTKIYEIFAVTKKSISVCEATCCCRYVKSYVRIPHQWKEIRSHDISMFLLSKLLGRKTI